MKGLRKRERGKAANMKSSNESMDYWTSTHYTLVECVVNV